MYFSFNGRDLREKELRLLRAVPMDRLLIESDSPDQMPRHLSQYSLRCNEPVFVRYACEEVAKALGLAAAEVAAITTANAVRVYQR